MDQSASEWFEDESLWQRTFPFMFPEASFVAAAENVPKIVGLAQVSGGDVLDLACGPGRYAIPLAQTGFRVTGVDRTEFLLTDARRRAGLVGATVEWVQDDMRHFVRPAAFDLAINVFTSFGYFDQASDNRRVLENLYASLRPGGKFVFDHVGKELLAERFQPTISDSLPDGTLLIHRNSITDDWSRVDGQWMLIAGDSVTQFRIRHWLYSGQEFRDLLSSVGFVDIALYGSFEATPYGRGAKRLVAVAKKPESGTGG